MPAENIESFSILKDASATAIYGSRGANGVMIVTTKGGEYNSKTSINVTAENSFNYLDKFPEFVDGATYMDMYNKASLARNSSATPKYSATDMERTASGVNPYLYPDVNWQDVLFKNMSMRQRANVNISGGGSKVKYYMSLDVSHDSGLLNTGKAYSWNNNINIMNYTFQNNIAYKLNADDNNQNEYERSDPSEKKPECIKRGFVQTDSDYYPHRISGYLSKSGRAYHVRQ